MTFGEHLDELRWALLKSILALLVGFLVALLFADKLVDYVQTPLRAALREHYRAVSTREYEQHLEQERDAGQPVPADLDAAADEFAQQGLVAEDRYIDPREALEALSKAVPGAVNRSALPARDATKPVRRKDLVNLRMYHDLNSDPRLKVIGLSMQEPFLVYIKAAMVLGAVLASPWVFYFMWQFLAAGLYPHEQKYVHVFLPFSLGLFLCGAAVAFFFAFKYVLGFLLWFYETMGVDPDPRITDWLTFVLILPLGFGISFQLPLVMLFLERVGIFSIATYLRQWRISVLVICVLSMVLTPSDPQSMILMAVPLIFLYFGGILLCKLMPRMGRRSERTGSGEAGG
jgi:sec-independent protein translocase protein TatC